MKTGTQGSGASRSAVGEGLGGASSWGSGDASPMLCISGCGLQALSPDERFCWIHFVHHLAGKCVVSGCDSRWRSHGFCHTHYMARLRSRAPVPKVALTDFLERAACAGMDTEDFFGEPSIEAVRACSRCSVRAECLAWAIANDEAGFWGGMTRAERARHHLLPPKKLRYSEDETCEVRGCDRKPQARGLCHKHDMRRRRHGSPHVVKVKVPA